MAVYMVPGVFGAGGQILDTNGKIAAGALVNTYAAGTTSTVATFTTLTGNVTAANPIVCSADGRLPAEMWQTTGQAIKIILTDSLANTLGTYDNLRGINDPTFILAVILSTTNTWTAPQTFTAPTTFTSSLTVSATSVFTSTVTISALSVFASTVSVGGTVVFSVSSGAVDIADNLLTGICEGRLTLTSQTPVTSVDVTAATTVFFAPYKGNRISLYDGSAKWKLYNFSQLSIAVPATTNTMYDLWCFDNSGVPTLEALAWSSDTARATALTTQDGVDVKTGATTRRYLGSFRTTGSSGQTEDSVLKRYVWNNYNRVVKSISVVDATDTWQYTLNAWRLTNSPAANQLDVVIGKSEDIVRIRAIHNVQSSGIGTRVNTSIGLDSYITSAATVVGSVETPVANITNTLVSEYVGYPGVGRHFLAWLERSVAAGTTTWQGDNGLSNVTQSGMAGEVNC